MENENSTKELDLIDVIKICWGWFVSYICKPVVFVVRFCLKKWWVGVIAIIVGLAASLLIGKYSPKYVGHIIFRNNVCASSDFIGDVRLMTTTIPETKMQTLHLSYEKSKAIKAIWGHQLCYLDSLHTSYVVDLDDELAQKGRDCVPNMFDIEIVAKDESVFDSIQYALLHYFSNSEYYVQQNAVRHKALAASINIIDIESSKLDSTREQWESPILTTDFSNSGNGLSAVLNPTLVSNELIRLHDVSTSFANTLDYSPEVVTVVTPLRYDGVPVNCYAYTWKKYVLLCLVAAYGVALLIAYRRKIYDFIKG